MGVLISLAARVVGAQYARLALAGVCFMAAAGAMAWAYATGHGHGEAAVRADVAARIKEQEARVARVEELYRGEVTKLHQRRQEIEDQVREIDDVIGDDDRRCFSDDVLRRLGEIRLRQEGSP